MHPLDARTLTQLSTLGERGRAASETSLRAHAAQHPTLRCVRCAGRGCYVEAADSARRGFDFRDFDASRGDRYYASCIACFGLGSVACTHAQLAAVVDAANEDARRQYKSVRSEVCALRSMSCATFDRIVRRHLVSAAGVTALDWLNAAQRVRAVYV